MSSQSFWTGSSDDTRYWTENTGATGSSGTGPSAGNTGSYIYYEATSYEQFKLVLFLNLIVNLSSPVSSLSFYYHAHGSAMGTLTVDYSTNSGTSWTTISTPVNGTDNTWF